jgi:hypothetical protein
MDYVVGNEVYDHLGRDVRVRTRSILDNKLLPKLLGQPLTYSFGPYDLCSIADHKIARSTGL